MHGAKRFTGQVMAAILAASALSRATADDWLFFRGPHRNGVSDETGWLTQWPESGPKIAWRKDLGAGAASFTVSGDRVLTMGNINDQDIVYCLNSADGSEHWVFKYDCPLNKRQFEGGPAATPTIDGDCVFTLSWAGQLHCLSLRDGKVLWQKHLVGDFGGVPPQWKYAGSVLVAGDSIIVDAGGKGSSTLALDKRTGAKIWGSGDDVPGYATPIPFDQGSVRGVLVFKAKHLVAQRMDNGQELWRFPWETAYDVNASSPIVIGGNLFVSSGYPKGRAAMYRLTKAAPEQVWVNEDVKTRMSTCAPHGGFIYGITEKGAVLTCMEQATGTIAWQQKGFGNYGTLVIADGKILALTESGTLVVAKADGSGYSELSRAQVLNGRCWVNPVLANGRIYCKDNSGMMVCLDVRQ